MGSKAVLAATREIRVDTKAIAAEPTISRRVTVRVLIATTSATRGPRTGEHPLHTTEAPPLITEHLSAAAPLTTEHLHTGEPRPSAARLITPLRRRRRTIPLRELPLPLHHTSREEAVVRREAQAVRLGVDIRPAAEATVRVDIRAVDIQAADRTANTKP
jgi:hypothetical protein